MIYIIRWTRSHSSFIKQYKTSINYSQQYFLSITIKKKKLLYKSYNKSKVMFIEHPIQIQIQLMTFETVTIFNIMYGWKGLKQNDFGFFVRKSYFPRIWEQIFSWQVGGQRLKVVCWKVTMRNFSWQKFPWERKNLKQKMTSERSSKIGNVK